MSTPNCRHTIASFGEIGPELSGAINGEPAHRATVVQKLCSADSALTEEKALRLLEALRGNVVHPQEHELRSLIVGGLRNTIAGAEANTAFELLHFWMYDAAERRRPLTRLLLVKTARAHRALSGNFA